MWIFQWISNFMGTSLIVEWKKVPSNLKITSNFLAMKPFTNVKWMRFLINPMKLLEYWIFSIGRFGITVLILNWINFNGQSQKAIKEFVEILPNRVVDCNLVVSALGSDEMKSLDFWSSADQLSDTRTNRIVFIIYTGIEIHDLNDWPIISHFNLET